MKIICIGRNYGEHIKELSNEMPDEPVVFLKPDTALLKNNAPFYYPSFSQEVDFEGELVIRINREGKNIEEKFAHKYYDEIGVGIDFTARDIQQKLKSKGLPWELAKGFNGSAVVSNFVSKSTLPDIQRISFSLLKNGSVMQEGNSENMIFSIDKIISFVSKYMTLKNGDFIFTGTPQGVGKITIGDKLELLLEGSKMLECEVK